MNVITDNDWELRLSTRYFIRIFQNPHLVDAVICGITVSLESTVVRSFDSDLVEHLADPAIYLSLYGHLCNST